MVTVLPGSKFLSPITSAKYARGGTYTNVDGIEFRFEPTIAFGQQALLELSNSLRSLRVPLEESVRAVIRPSIAKNFEIGGRPTWTVLSPNTLAKKSRGNAKPLVVKGKLKRAASQQNIWTFTRTSATILGGKLLSYAPYALYQQAGTGGHESKPIPTKDARGRTVFTTMTVGSIPPRPYLMIQEEDKEKVRKIFLLWLDQRIGMTWGA